MSSNEHIHEHTENTAKIRRQRIDKMAAIR